MSAFEYLLLFAAIILGLAATDLAISLHRLLSAGTRVKWDWLAPLAGVVAFLKIVTQWWAWHAGADLAHGFTFEMFLGELAACVFLFLLAAASLPDEIGPEGVDLASHFEQVRRRWWLLFFGHWLLSNGVSIWSQIVIGGARFGVTPGEIGAYVIGPLALALALIRNRWIQGAALILFAAFYVAQSFGHGLP